jgi:hypothetical protein
VAEAGVIQEECSEKLGFGAYRAVISMMVLRLKAQEQLKTHPAYSLDLLECREGYYQLRFRLRSRHRPYCAFNAGDECVCSASLSWSQPAPPTLGQRASQLMEILSKPKNSIQSRCQMVKRKLELRNNCSSHIIAVAGVPLNRSGQDRDEWRVETNKKRSEFVGPGRQFCA